MSVVGRVRELEADDRRAAVWPAAVLRVRMTGVRRSAANCRGPVSSAGRPEAAVTAGGSSARFPQIADIRYPSVKQREIEFTAPPLEGQRTIALDRRTTPTVGARAGSPRC